MVARLDIRSQSGGSTKLSQGQNRMFALSLVGQSKHPIFGGSQSAFPLDIQQKISI
jgi:hypothetical protein